MGLIKEVLLFSSSGAGGTAAEGEGGAGTAAGPAGALQKMLDTSQHSLGQGAGPQSRGPKVTPEPWGPTHSSDTKPLNGYDWRSWFRSLKALEAVISLFFYLNSLIPCCYLTDPSSGCLPAMSAMVAVFPWRDHGQDQCILDLF